MSDAGFMRALGYEFRDPALLQQALTHRSAASRHNERLEFLGDSVLGFVIAELLYETRPDAHEGDLSRLRARLVQGETLAELGASLDIGAHLRLGGGELKSGGFRRASILADAVEAVLGAVYLDGGFDVCRALIRSLFEDGVEGLADLVDLKDPKTRLQEYLQARGNPLPVYHVVGVQGKDHDQVFCVSCQSSEPLLEARGEGSSRRRAEQDAAGHMLRLLAEASDE